MLEEKSLFTNFTITASTLVGYQLTLCMPFMICAIFIGRLGDSVSLSSYGLATTIINIGFSSFLMGIQESLGVVCSRLYGAKHYNEMWRYLWKSLIFVFIITILFHLFSIYVARILIAIRIEEEVSLSCGRLLRLVSISLYFQGANQMINNFLSAQHIAKPLFYLNIISIGIVYVFGSVFINHLGYAELGYGYIKICQEAFNFVYYIVVLIKHTDMSSFEAPSMHTIKKHLWDFLLLNIYTVMAFYGEFLAFEINTYYAALLHDVDALAAWVSYINFTGIHYFVAVGFGASIRNLVGKRIGELKVKQARDESISYLKYIGVFSVVVMIFQFIYSDAIAEIFTSKQIVTRLLTENIDMFTICVYFTLIIPGINTLYRVVGKDRFMFWANVVAYPLGNAILNYILGFYFNYGLRGINISFICCTMAMSTTLVLYLYFNIEWRYVKHMDDVIDSVQEDLLERSIDLIYI